MSNATIFENHDKYGNVLNLVSMLKHSL